MEERSLSAGVELGSYTILDAVSPLCEGRLHRARSLEHRRRVVVRLLPHRFVENRPARQALFRTCRRATRLNHANIVGVSGFDRGEDYALLVLTPLAGVTLRERIDSGPLARPEWCRLAWEMADALACAHGADIAHGNVTSRVVILNEEGHARLFDFGVGGPSGKSPAEPRLQSPSDAFALDVRRLGAVLIEAATGCELDADPAHPEADKERVALGLAELERRTDLPRGYREVVRRCIDSDPAEGFASGRHVVEQLRRLDGRHVNRGTWRPATGTILAGLIGTAIVGWAVVVWWQTHGH